jgi:hypothetical protein
MNDKCEATEDFISNQARQFCLQLIHKSETPAVIAILRHRSIGPGILWTSILWNILREDGAKFAELI